MVHECRHIMPSGSKCKSPSLRQSAFCYHHVNLRRATAPKSVFHTIQLPSLEDSCGLQIALHEVLDAIVHQRIDSKRAGLLLYGLQIAAQLNARRADVPDPVRDVCHDDDGNDLAPEETACDPAEDNHDCPRTDQCDDCKEEKEDDDEDESEAVHCESSGSDADKNEDRKHRVNSPDHKPCHPVYDDMGGCPIHDAVSSRHEWETTVLPQAAKGLRP